MLGGPLTRGEFTFLMGVAFAILVLVVIWIFVIAFASPSTLGGFPRDAINALGSPPIESVRP